MLDSERIQNSKHVFFRGSRLPPPEITLKGQTIQHVEQFKYLGVIVDSNLTFKKHIAKISKSVKCNLAHFRFIRNQMSMDAAKMFMHAMIFSHLSYCSTTWSQSNITSQLPLHSLYKRALKTMDKKPISHHYCNIVKKHNLLTFDNLVFMAHVSLMYKITHNLAPQPLTQLVIKYNGTGSRTRASTRGDCRSMYRSTSFGQNCFSVKAAGMWNSLPVHT